MEQYSPKNEPEGSENFYVRKPHGCSFGPYSKSKAEKVAAYLNHLEKLFEGIKKLDLENAEMIEILENLRTTIKQRIEDQKTISDSSFNN